MGPNSKSEVDMKMNLFKNTNTVVLKKEENFMLSPKILRNRNDNHSLTGKARLPKKNMGSLINASYQ